MRVLSSRRRGARRGRLAAGAVAAALAVTTGLGFSLGSGALTAAAIVAPTFGHTVDLGNAGGEPSIHDDGHGHVYITTPQGLGSMGSGILLTRSTNGGQSFLPNQTIGNVVGGGDSDILSDVTTKNVYAADLTAVDAAVLRSTDFGATFGSPVQTGPENDREWLTTIGPTLFLTYHDFASNSPVIFISNDSGATWSPGGTGGMIIPPGDPAFADTKCNTLVGKPVSDVNGALYVLTNSSTLAEDIAVGGCVNPRANVPLDRFYLSVSTDGGHSFTTNLVNDVSAGATGKPNSGTWGHVFNQLGIDNGGNLYIAASGTLDGTLPLQNYVLVSKDHGKTFSKPIATHASNTAQLFPSIAVGQAGQVAVGYYEGTLVDHSAAGNNYQFKIDQTFNGADASPVFTDMQLTPLKGTTPHPDGICTAGIFCLPGQSNNRNLADFESMAVDPTGNLEVIIPADCKGSTPQTTCTGTENWFYKQTAGPLMPPGPTNGNGTGNQTWVAGARTAPPPGPAAPNTVVPNTAAGVGPQAPVALAATLLGTLGAVAIGATGILRRRRRQIGPGKN